MRTWIIGIAVFLLWSTGASYWYVCKIKGLCPVFEGSTTTALTTKTDAGDSIAVDTAEKSDTLEAIDSLPITDTKKSDEPSKVDAGTLPASLKKPFTILFAFAGPQAEGKAALDTYLDDLAGYLKQHPSKKAVLKGYTDDTAARENNLKLAQRRCETVASLLEGRGITGESLILEPLGEADPVADNDTPEGRRLNRRVVISLQQ